MEKVKTLKFFDFSKKLDLCDLSSDYGNQFYDDFKHDLITLRNDFINDHQVTESNKVKALGVN